MKLTMARSRLCGKTGWVSAAAAAGRALNNSWPAILCVRSTAQGDIRTNVVVNACGVWAPNIGAMAGVPTPLCAMHHAYVVTERIAGTQRLNARPTTVVASHHGGCSGIENMPNVRDHDASVYLKLQGDALSIGGYEIDPIYWEKVLLCAGRRLHHPV